MQTPEILKFVLLGDKCIGKRTILSTGFGKPQRLSSLYLPIEFVEISVRSKNRNWNAICYDSLVSTSSVSKNEAAAVETFNATALNGADAVLFCYAADNAESFRSLNRWYKDVAVHLSPNTLLYLVETKGDLPNKVNESDERDFTSHVKFQSHFKVCGLNREHVLNMFAAITEKVEEIRNFNQSQSIYKTSTYKSPEKKATKGPIQDVRYSDKKEKIVLMEGSYVKKLSVVESKKTLSDSTQRLQQKHLGDDDLRDF